MNDHIESSQYALPLLNAYADIVRLALLRLNNVKSQIDVVKRDPLIVQADRDKLQSEYATIKRRLEQRMRGFVVIYIENCDTHALVPTWLEQVEQVQVEQNENS